MFDVRHDIRRDSTAIASPPLQPPPPPVSQQLPPPSPLPPPQQSPPQTAAVTASTTMTVSTILPVQTSDPPKKKRLPTARHGLVTKGLKIQLLSNHFKVNITHVDGHFFHYSIDELYHNMRLLILERKDYASNYDIIY